MAVGSITYFDRALPKITNNTISLGADTFHMVLTTSTQAITAAFAGTSTNCQYSDLTNEVATANGYTVGGLALSAVTWTRATGTMTFTSSSAVWTLTGVGITWKYGIIVDWTGANKDLVCFFDVDNTGGSSSPGSGTFTIAPNASGWFTLTHTP